MGKIYNDIEVSGDGTDNKSTTEYMLNAGRIVEARTDVRFRDAEINRVYNIMDRSAFRTVLLVGDHGCGKRTIIEGYANKLKENARQDLIVEIDFNEVIKEAQANNNFGQIMESIFTTAATSTDVDVVLVLNNLGHLLNLNCYGNAGFSFINSLIRYIEEPDSNLKVIATATTDEYKVIDDAFKRILDFFTVIKPTELTVEQTQEIINNERDFYQGYYDLHLPENIAELICKNADKYIKDRPFPGKAELLLDEVCSGISNKYRPADSRLIEIFNELEDCKAEMAKAKEANDLVKVEEINHRIDAIFDRKNELGKESYPTIDVTEPDVLESIGSIVDVKMSKLSKDQTKFLRDMPDELKKNVIGQDDAVDVIVRNIRRNQLGLRKTSHSAGNFMFIGSTGVGKTYLAKQIAKYLYGSEDNFLRLDMSEFQTEIDVTKLLGSAPGYVGYKESGLLVKGLAKKPETVVLFDEIEKAHPKIYDVLLQLLDEGFITGSDGKKVDATKALIIFTSNIGVKQAQEMANPLGFAADVDAKKDERKEKTIRKALKNRFSPEFLNRLDNICYFNSLSEDTLKSILHKELDETNEMIKALTGDIVVLSPEAEEWIIKKVKAEDNGARPIIRILQQNIEEPITDMIINEDPIMNVGMITAYLEDDKIVLR